MIYSIVVGLSCYALGAWFGYWSSERSFHYCAQCGKERMP